jgi:predicted DsbA family dithiol-disulfide isomerase
VTSHEVQRDLKGILFLFVMLSVAQSVLVFLTLQGQRAEAKRFEQVSASLGQHFGMVEDFIKYSSDGGWVDLEAGRGPAEGSNRPVVDIVEFADFECPACAASYLHLKGLVDAYGQSVRLRFRHYPITTLHPTAYNAALAGVCLDRSGKFWEYANTLYGEQERLSREQDDFVRETAIALGMPADSLDSCMSDPETRKLVERDRLIGRSMAVTSTPTFFINGRRLDGARWEVLEAVILSELRKAGRPALPRYATPDRGAVGAAPGR